MESYQDMMMRHDDERAEMEARHRREMDEEMTYYAFAVDAFFEEMGNVGYGGRGNDCDVLRVFWPELSRTDLPAGALLAMVDAGDETRRAFFDARQVYLKIRDEEREAGWF